MKYCHHIQPASIAFRVHGSFQSMSRHFNKFYSSWESKWTSGNKLPWDTGCPAPPLEKVLASGELGHASFLKKSTEGREEPRRRRVLVPGCGGGYDVAAFAEHGWEALGLELAPTAVAAAREYCGALPGEVGERINILEGDFFSLTTETSREGGTRDGKQLLVPPFDVIFDYTFLCALPPDLRPNWAMQMSRLLRPGGQAA
uniref:Thiol methyltransferase 2 n=1 Tax=Fibrocapsa japonica TaxID=94617 RepID=A0A7S2V0Z5_9STRA|mmetsp:Transcript_22861/g.33172  ORF Transcript_22861/g.33172 Transcript_22861/m.33172 type:complete len:201 (+) Transcript_22861:60-662(+)